MDVCEICQKEIKPREHKQMMGMAPIHRKCRKKVPVFSPMTNDDANAMINHQIMCMDKLIRALRDIIEDIRKQPEEPKPVRRVRWWSMILPSLVIGALLLGLSAPLCAQSNALPPGSPVNPWVIERRGPNTYTVHPQVQTTIPPLAPGGIMNPWIIERRGQHGDLTIHTQQPYVGDAQEYDE